MRTVEALRREAADNWNQTFYLLYFRTLGDRRNQEAYLELARRVPYRVVLRERRVPHAIEAMLFGASGLLDLYRNDEYTLNLRRNFEHLAAKYDIRPMEAAVWELAEIRPANHPVLRLAQAAEFFAQDEFVMDRTMACRSEEDVRRLFGIEAAVYWRTHFVPAAESDSRPKRIGAFKANIIGINLVVVLQFAYGSFMANERLRDSALSLLERLPAEDNRYMRDWAAAACARATPSKVRPCCNSRPNTVRSGAARSVPSDAGSQNRSRKCNSSPKRVTLPETAHSPRAHNPSRHGKQLQTPPDQRCHAALQRRAIRRRKHRKPDGSDALRFRTDRHRRLLNRRLGGRGRAAPTTRPADRPAAQRTQCRCGRNPESRNGCGPRRIHRLPRCRRHLRPEAFRKADRLSESPPRSGCLRQLLFDFQRP